MVYFYEKITLEKSLSEIERVQWIPKRGKNRIKSMVDNRPDGRRQRASAFSNIFE